MGDTIFSVGCPNLNWPSMFMGNCILDFEDMFVFGPEVIAGRSGSPMLDRQGRVVGMIIWQGQKCSIAVTASRMIELHDWSEAPVFDVAE